ncbi:MAG: adenylate/guanylate cyclase domain-containing protein [Mariprofundaceae bacterium]|nr:adenylate/guanylate cyclase domain-containing protein [Mariprofundaceae bacterium]
MKLTQDISLFAAMVLIFHFAGFYVLRRFSDELLDLIQYSSLLSRQKYNYKQLDIKNDDTSEVANIKMNFNTLLIKLEQEQVKFHTVTVGLLNESRKDSHEYERRLKALSPYVDQRVIHQIIDNTYEGSRELRGEHRRVSVLFVDICSFTQTSEHLAPEAVVAMLNEFFDIAVDIIYRHNGIVDKFIGDAVMAIFGLTTPIYQVSVDAISAALELQTASQVLMCQWEKEGRKTFRIRAGINTGPVIAGDIGSRDRMDYTVIGDTVNVASRMVDHAVPGKILISGETYGSCKPYFRVQPRGKIKVKNRTQAVEAFTIIGKNDATFSKHELFLSTGKITIQQLSRLR